MDINLTPNDLIAFEDDIAKEFASGKIKSPVHLSGGNEEQLIDIFKNIQPNDWVFSGWRSHYHCLLKGVPPDKLKYAIMNGASVALTFPEYKVFCSGICGGIAPIAAGVAWALKQKNNEDYSGNEQKVHVFLGDMSARMGVVYEAIQYSHGHQLPIEFYIEDNGVSVVTDTEKSWGNGGFELPVVKYSYKLKRAHCGVGVWVKL